MIITPEEKSNEEVKTRGYYACPTCKVQTTASKVPSSWVSCPMIGGKDICIGCCIDLQVVASSRRFEGHPIFSDFLKVANKYRKSPSKMRIICLNHQIELWEYIIANNLAMYNTNEEIGEHLKYLNSLKLEMLSD